MQKILLQTSIDAALAKPLQLAYRFLLGATTMKTKNLIPCNAAPVACETVIKSRTVAGNVTPSLLTMLPLPISRPWKLAALPVAPFAGNNAR